MLISGLQAVLKWFLLFRKIFCLEKFQFALIRPGVHEDSISIESNHYYFILYNFFSAMHPAPSVVSSLAILRDKGIHESGCDAPGNVAEYRFKSIIELWYSDMNEAA